MRFGDRLGSVLFRVPAGVERDDRRLASLLEAWPGGLRLTLEFQHLSWFVDEVFALLQAAGAACCATELETADGPPAIRRTGGFLYLRLRRDAYTRAELRAWAARVVPFLEAGDDVYAFFRHDQRGESALRAMELGRLVDAELG